MSIVRIASRDAIESAQRPLSLAGQEQSLSLHERRIARRLRQRRGCYRCGPRGRPGCSGQPGHDLLPARGHEPEEEPDGRDPRAGECEAGQAAAQDRPRLGTLGLSEGSGGGGETARSLVEAIEQGLHLIGIGSEAKSLGGEPACVVDVSGGPLGVGFMETHPGHSLFFTQESADALFAAAGVGMPRIAEKHAGKAQGGLASTPAG